MLDLTGIMFSSIMMLAVILRALQLDRTEAWFPKLKKAESATPKRKPWQRGR